MATKAPGPDAASGNDPAASAGTPTEGPVASDAAGLEAIIEQAAGMAVQDALAHLRNAQTIANAVQGAVQEMLLRGEEVARAEDAAALSKAAVDAAMVNYEKLFALATAFAGRREKPQDDPPRGRSGN